MAWSDWKKLKLLASDGIVAEAEILRRDTRTERDDDGNVTFRYFLTYAFRPEGQSDMIEAQQEVPAALYYNTPEGSFLPATYVWHRPEISTLTPARSGVGAIIFGLLGGALALASAGGLVWSAQRVASAMRAL